jgi:uncharacterized protein (DUF427 family)
MAGHITITPISGTVTVSAGSTVLGKSTRALALKEGSYPAVVYVPREDIAMDRLVRTPHKSSCPWKGQASYYSVKGDFAKLANAVWSYEEPKPEVAAIAGHLAFYTDRITLAID